SEMNRSQMESPRLALLAPQSSAYGGGAKRAPVPVPEILELETIVKSIASSKCPIRSKYGEDLSESLKALVGFGAAEPQRSSLPTESNLLADIRHTRQAVRTQFDTICNALKFGDPRYQWLKEGNLWPCI